MLGQATELAGEGEEAWPRSVVKRLFAKPIARQEQLASRSVENCKRKHAIEAKRQFLSPFFPTVNQHLGVRMVRREAVAKTLEFASQFSVVVDFTIEDDRDLPVLVPHRLMARSDINHSQPSMADIDCLSFIDEKPVTIRATMGKRPSHGLQVAPGPVPDEADYSAHS